MGPEPAGGRPRVVFAARFPPWPPTSGAPIRMHRVITGLAEEFDVLVVAHDGADGGPEGAVDPEAVRQALPGVRYLPISGRCTPKRLGQLASLCRRRSYGHGRYATPALRRAVREAAVGAALIHFDDPATALTGRVAGVVNVVAPHDLTSVLTMRSATDDGPVRRLFGLVDGGKQVSEERSVWRAMDLCVAVSDVDARQMRAAGARAVVVCPNGTDPVDRLPPAHRAPDEPLRLVFVGNGRFRPNAQGLRWLVEQVLPRARASAPVTLEAVGLPPPRPVDAPGVAYRGRVPDVRPFYERAHAAVVPIPFGSGSRLKMVEAMAYGRPVVATAAGAEGLPVTAGRHYLEADSAAEFAAALGLLGDAVGRGEEWLERMLAEARAVAERLFWPRIARDLATTYRAMTAGAPRAGAPA